MEELTLFDVANLDALIDEYATKKTKLDEEKKELEALNKKIVEALEKQQLNKYNNDKHTVTLAYKNTFKYKNEAELIILLSDNVEYTQYVVPSIDSKKLNALIKANNSVAEFLKDFYDISTSTSLSVK